MSHKPAQIIYTARMSWYTLYITTSNGFDLFINFSEISNCKHNFHEIIDDINSNYYNCTDGMASNFYYGLIENTIKIDTFLFL